VLVDVEAIDDHRLRSAVIAAAHQLIGRTR
jgi:hypothetical protein